ncbi:MAG: transcription elongation factor GreA [Patescibacteria group bacterium]
MNQVYLTQERHDEIVEEIADLKVSGRRQIAERLKQAKELGDLSENADYQEAKEEQARLEQRILNLEETLRNSAIIKKSAGAATVRIGSRVQVRKNGENTYYTIVGSNESQPANGLISNESPIGRALLGKKVGDAVKILTPKGEVIYQILAIE